VPRRWLLIRSVKLIGFQAQMYRLARGGAKRACAMISILDAGDRAQRSVSSAMTMFTIASSGRGAVLHGMVSSSCTWPNAVLWGAWTPPVLLFQPAFTRNKRNRGGHTGMRPGTMAARLLHDRVFFSQPTGLPPCQHINNACSVLDSTKNSERLCCCWPKGKSLWCQRKQNDPRNHERHHRNGLR